jgi:tRNA wybutosine-synthesizing protein 1
MPKKINLKVRTQLTPEYKKKLEHQQYRTVGSHSAVKVCGWTKDTIRDEGVCYKNTFYGIKSHKCLQMSCNLGCANRCVFCWRDDKGPLGKEWEWELDEPSFIIDESIKEHQKLLIGFRGSEKANKKILEESKEVAHVALSLIGEPIAYPKFNELVKQFHERKISTFVVTNGQYPKEIKNLNTVTQLYLSMDAPSPEIAKIIGVPLFKDHWNRFNKSLDYCAKKKFRTTARITIVKGINDLDPEGYAKLIKKGDFDFIEIKDYVHVGASRERLSKENMALMPGVRKFSREILEFLPKYEKVSEHKASKVVLLAKKKFNGKTQIDFEKFFKLVNKKPYPKNLDEKKYRSNKKTSKTASII